MSQVRSFDECGKWYWSLLSFEVDTIRYSVRTSEENMEKSMLEMCSVRKNLHSNIYWNIQSFRACKGKGFHDPCSAASQQNEENEDNEGLYLKQKFDACRFPF